jgi:hypothetical protein
MIVTGLRFSVSWLLMLKEKSSSSEVVLNGRAQSREVRHRRLRSAVDRPCRGLGIAVSLLTKQAFA